jgi:hypothetical protein
MSSHLRLGHLICLYPTGFLTKMLCAFLIALMRATFLAHIILLNLITRILSVEMYKL